MGGGSSAPQPTNTTVTQTSLPSYARPYYEDLMARAQGESNRGYTPYGGQRVAGFSPGQTSAQQGIMGLQGVGQFNTATDIAQQAGLAGLNAGQYTPGQFDSMNVSPTGQATTSSWTDAGVSNQYMSPYMQNVVDVQKNEALRDAQKGILMQNLGAGRQGTYGGARQLLAGTERERNLLDQMSQIQATGSQNAYMSGMGQFNQEQGLGLQAQQFNLGQGMQSQLANQQAGLETQRMGEQSRQFAGTLGLQGLDHALRGAQTLGDLGTKQQTSDLQRLQAQGAVGADQRALQQQLLDTQYADFLRQRDYPMEQLGYYSNLLHGVPVGLGSTSTTYGQPPSTASQVGGLGLAALGAYNLANG